MSFVGGLPGESAYESPCFNIRLINYYEIQTKSLHAGCSSLLMHDVYLSIMENNPFGPSVSNRIGDVYLDKQDNRF